MCEFCSALALPPPTSTAAWPRGLPRRHGNFACNSLLGISNFEFVSLELQRFWALLKVHAIELHAKFGEGCVAGVWWGVGARIFSPCSDRSGRECEKVRPAHDKSPKSGVLWPAGRTFSRKHWWRGCAGRTFSRNSGRRRCAGRVSYRYRPPRPRAGTVLYRKRLCMRDKVLPARVVGGESGKKFSLRAKSGPKSAFWGVPGEFCTGWAAEPGGRESFVPVDPVEPGSRASFVSLRARRGLHRAFLATIDAPPIDAAVIRCRCTWAQWPCQTG